jgi:hypothetical protein
LERPRRIVGSQAAPDIAIQKSILISKHWGEDILTLFEPLSSLEVYKEEIEEADDAEFPRDRDLRRYRGSFRAAIVGSGGFPILK